MTLGSSNPLRISPYRPRPRLPSYPASIVPTFGISSVPPRYTISLFLLFLDDRNHWSLNYIHLMFDGKKKTRYSPNVYLFTFFILHHFQSSTSSVCLRTERSWGPSHSTINLSNYLPATRITVPWTVGITDWSPQYIILTQWSGF